jgi:raffinose/stachyose/melibiose transport system substrate-binding protein
MKKVLLLSLALILMLSILAACGGSGNNNTGTNQKDSQNTGSDNAGSKNSGSQKEEKKVIHILQLKREINDTLKDLTDEYTKEHPNVEFKFTFGGESYDTTLKAAFASGNEPDIFTSNGDAHAELWQDKYVDLTNEPWMDEMSDGTKPSITIDGKIYGMAYNVEGFGYIYNKDLFEQAGITELPKTISELEEVAKKLQSAGITPFVNAYKETWTLGKHGMNAGYARQSDPVAWAKGIANGTESFVGNEAMLGYLNLIDLMVEYGNKNALTTDYNASTVEFAAGNAAMIQQGVWTQSIFDGLNPGMNLGMFPMPISDDVEQNDNLFAFAGNYWVINNESEVIPEAKDFLNWMVTSDTGKDYMVNTFKFIPAFSNIDFTIEQLGPLAGELTKYTNSGRTKGRYYNMMPPGSDAEFGSTLQKYVAGQMTKEEVLLKFDDIVKKLIAK